VNVPLSPTHILALQKHLAGLCAQGHPDGLYRPLDPSKTTLHLGVRAKFFILLVTASDKDAVHGSRLGDTLSCAGTCVV
jgi:hypothetical protein